LGIETEERLEELLSEPTQQAINVLGRVPGDVIVLGVAGKMGPSLARMAKRASDAAGVRRRVIGVSRFSSGGRDAFEKFGIETVACDLSDEESVAKLPDAPNVIYMAGKKFGSTGDEAGTWAANCYLPSLVCRKYRRSRIVAFSTGNVYGLSEVSRGGSRETDVPQPVGEYAMSALGRERIFEYFSRTLGIPTAIIRLNYACEMRYGVLVDIAERIWTGQPVDLGMSFLNTIWQGDANAMSLCALEHVATPPWIVNVTGPELTSVRKSAERLSELLGKPVKFTGEETKTALLSNASQALGRLGTPRVDVPEMMRWIADWVRRGGKSLRKPTHFESRDGRF
jgi:nucleoside-diphosphate-sugar epimerase